MPIPHLYILHPAESRLPGITARLASAQDRVRNSAAWDDCSISTFEYDPQAGFNVPTVSDFVLRNPGPVLLIQKVQHRLRTRLEELLKSRVVVYCAEIACDDDLWAILEEAREAHEDGQPRVPLREVIAYLILRKLESQGKWGGEAKNKAFLWSDDLARGGFPKDLCDAREIMNVAQELAKADILSFKKSEGKSKYALGEKGIVQPILDSHSFTSQPSLKKFFERNSKRVNCRILDQQY